MGVHGLTGFLKQSGIDHRNDSTITLSHNSSTLAIDGNGLIFHLYRLSYYRHRKDVLSSTNQHNKELQAQLLLPTLLPLHIVHETATSYLSDLTTKHGVHLRIFFDGPDQYMKREVKRSRTEQRCEKWDNVHQLCMHGALPEDGPSRFKSSARKQAREYEQQLSGNGGDAEAEMYLSSFPVSPLVMDQIERSIFAFEDMSPVLPCGSIQIIECDGEADSEVAKASADDPSGMTFALACDSDYFIYGYPDDTLADRSVGETKYLQFQQIDPRADELRVSIVATRNDVALSLGLPSSSAMVDLSILLGNDYTVSYIKHSDQRKEYWESIQWCEEGEQDCGDGERLPPENELSWHNIAAITDHVAEKVSSGLRLTSDIEELKVAIEFSYALFSFGDIRGFLPTPSEALEVDEVIDAPTFPSLPIGVDLSIAEDVDDCLAPVLSYKSNAGSEDELHYIEPRHIDAFRMALEYMAEPERHIESPRHKLHWADMKSLHVLETCLLAAIGNDTRAMPYHLFDQSVFHSVLEALSFDDSPIENELSTKGEKSFMEELTSRNFTIQEEKKEDPCGSLVLPIDEHRDDILNTIKTQRVTIIHGETGCGKSSRVPCFLLRADPPQPTRAAPEVKMIVSQPRRIAAKALAERVRNSEPELKDKIALRSKFLYSCTDLCYSSSFINSFFSQNIVGHGMKEHETRNTRCWFVTTGYVVRLVRICDDDILHKVDDWSYQLCSIYSWLITQDGLILTYVMHAERNDLVTVFS